MYWYSRVFDQVAISVVWKWRRMTGHRIDWRQFGKCLSVGRGFIGEVQQGNNCLWKLRGYNDNDYSQARLYMLAAEESIIEFWTQLFIPIEKGFKDRPPQLIPPASVFILNVRFQPLNSMAGKLPTLVICFLNSNCGSETCLRVFKVSRCQSESIATFHPFRPIEGHKWFFPDFQPEEEPVCIYLFRQNPVFTSLPLPRRSGRGP